MSCRRLTAAELPDLLRLYAFLRPEDPVDHLELCRTTGVFRTKLLQVPSEAAAQQALRRLLTSKAWLKIKWKEAPWNSTGGGPSYDLSQANTVAYLTAQTKKV